MLKLEAVGDVARHETHYRFADTALYALALGAGPGDLPYLYERPPTKVLPTFGVIPAFGPVLEVLHASGGDLVQLLHTAQTVELLRPFPSAGQALTRARLRGLWDARIGATAIVDTETEVDGVPCARTVWELLLRGEGGFGGARPPERLRVTRPKGAPALFRSEVPTLESQALLYRLTGDVNPIHADPEVARAAGFDRPILHGLCTYAIAARAALAALAGDDPARFVSLEARFAKVVFPGETLVVEGFALDEPGTAAITVTALSTGEQPIGAARFRYRP